MSVLDNQTKANINLALYGGGGGGSGSNITASTITLQGSADPLEITLPYAGSNDGFSVRQGGATNALAILTIDAGNPGQAEFGIRSLSTISGNPVPRVRFEQQLIPGIDGGIFSLTLDRNGSGNASTIATLNFGPSSGGTPDAGGLFIGTELDASLNIGGSGYQIETNSQTTLNPRVITPTANIYVPPTGATQNIAAFSTVSGNVYEIYIPNLRVQNQPAGAPAAGAWSQLVVDTGVGALDTFDMSSVSTINNDYQGSRNYCFLATASGHNLQAIGSLSNTLSTAMSFTSPIFIRQLGLPAAMNPADIAP